MKNTLRILMLGFAVLAGTSGSAQTMAPAPSDSGRESIARKTASSDRETTEDDAPRFDLDFRGGTPAELVAAIEKAQGGTLNVVIPTEHAKVMLPSFRMRGVSAAQIFSVLGKASTSTDRDPISDTFMSSTSYAFEPAGKGIWYFSVRASGTLQPQQVRAYLLTPYLEMGLTVDDITTALQTSWKMLGRNSELVLRYHKETKLLIACGNPQVHLVVEQVFDALRPAAAKSNAEAKRTAK